MQALLNTSLDLVIWALSKSLSNTFSGLMALSRQGKIYDGSLGMVWGFLYVVIQSGVETFTSRKFSKQRSCRTWSWQPRSQRVSDLNILMNWLVEAFLRRGMEKGAIGGSLLNGLPQSYRRPSPFICFSSKVSVKCYRLCVALLQATL